jgi:uncharacterized phage protein gp47/JayE
MSLPALGSATYPTPNEVRDGILRAIRFAFARRGLLANILPGSDHFIRAEKYASRVAIAIANNQLALADSDPLTALGAALERLAGIFGIFKRGAEGAAGLVTIVSATTVSIPKDFQCTAPDGQTYQTITAATVANGGTIAVKATTRGKASDQAAGVVVTWDSAAIGALNPKATVAAGGLTGGANADDDERLRTRLLDHLANPSVGGNWANVVEWAEASTSSVEAAYGFPACRGPASYDVAVTAAGGDRTLSAAALAPVRAYLLSKMPGQNSLNVTSVTPNPVDVVVAARLPLPTAAGGAGGGWRASAPWPAEATQVSAYNAGTGVATVTSTAAPTVGAPIGVWDPTTRDADDELGLMREYAVASVGGGAGAWTITVQGGFAVSPLGAYVSAGAEFLVDYAAAFRNQILKLGPGEKTALPELLPLAARHPTPDVVAPSALTSKQLAALTDGANAFGEILGLDYALRVDTGTATPRTAPPIPLTAEDPPGILTLSALAFIYAA